MAGNKTNYTILHGLSSEKRPALRRHLSTSSPRPCYRISYSDAQYAFPHCSVCRWSNAPPHLTAATPNGSAHLRQQIVPWVVHRLCRVYCRSLFSVYPCSLKVYRSSALLSSLCIMNHLYILWLTCISFVVQL